MSLYFKFLYFAFFMSSFQKYGCFLGTIVRSRSRLVFCSVLAEVMFFDIVCNSIINYTWANKYRGSE